MTRLLDLVSEYVGLVRWVDEDLAGPSDARLVRALCETVEPTDFLRHPVHAGAAEPTRSAAVAATLGEAAERYALLQYPVDVPPVTADDLPGRVEPERLELFHQHQHGVPGFPFCRFDRRSRVRWVEATSVVSGERVFVPAQLVWLQAKPPVDETPIGFATSSGAACGDTKSEATLRATLELIERDAFMITWYNRLSLDRLSWADDRAAAAYATERFDPTGLTYAAVDLSVFLGVPTVLGIVRGPNGEAPLGIGAASAPTMSGAWRKALGEAFSVRTSAGLSVARRAATRPDFGPRFERLLTFEDHVHLYAFDETLHRCDFLDSSNGVRSVTTVDSLPGTTAREQVAGLAERLRRASIDVFVVDIHPGRPLRAGRHRHARRVARPLPSRRRPSLPLSRPRASSHSACRCGPESTSAVRRRAERGPAPVPVTTTARSARLASLVYGSAAGIGDPVEDYHEASSLYPTTVAHQMRGGTRLRRSATLARSITRSVRRRSEAPTIAMPGPEALTAPLGSVLRGRRSVRTFTDRPIELRALSTLLASASGPTHDLEDQGIVYRLRAAPSAGGLFPLDVYVCALAVLDVECGVHHYDPLRHVLARLPSGANRETIGSALLQAAVVDAAACVILLAATFSRSRVKYGARGYRFTLLEAGHVAQNILLAAEALGIAAVPIGGFFDRRLSALIGADGVDEAVVYAVAMGSL